MRLLRMQCVQKICGLHWILWHPQVETQLNDLVAGHHPRMRLILWNKMKKVHHCIFALKFKLKFFYFKLKPIDCMDNHTIFESTLYYCFHYCTGMPLSSFDHMKVGLCERIRRSLFLLHFFHEVTALNAWPCSLVVATCENLALHQSFLSCILISWEGIFEETEGIGCFLIFYSPS